MLFKNDLRMKNKINLFYFCLLITFLNGCSPKIPQSSILNFNKENNLTYAYFSNGHLQKEQYAFKTVKKNGRVAGEIVRAADAGVWSGIATNLNAPIRLSEGKKFKIDVWMDHLGTFAFKLENSTNGGANKVISVKNTKINQWETLLFDFSEAIYGSPSYSKVAIFVDLNNKPTGKDVTSYFSNVHQLPSDSNKIIVGNKDEAIKIVVIGSSTAAGTGPKDFKNAWVNRYRRKLQELNGYNQVINLAVGGYTTYQLLPTEAEVPTDRPPPDSLHNVSKALSLNPDAVLINLPSNDANKGYSVKEQLANYTKICQPLYDKDIPVWVSTTQGRNMEKDKQKVQIIMRDSTEIRFGRNTLDFWRDLADWSGNINPKYNSGDGIHLNDEGHRLLFEEVWLNNVHGAVLDKKLSIIRKDSAYSSPLKYDGYTLVWQDEFNRTALDSTSWTHELGNGCPELCGWGNNEKVWYSPESTQVTDGKLIITAKVDEAHKGYWTGSRIITNGKVDFQFGRIDIRAKLPETKGQWPALWLLGTNRFEKGWPYCGEIDIMEEKGHLPHQIRGTIHYKGTNNYLNSSGTKYELKYGNFSDDFHVFSIIWNKEGIKFFVDDQLFGNQIFNKLNIVPTDNPFFKPFYMIINNAVGGNYGGDPDATSVFPQTLEVDYVRYFKENRVLSFPKVVETPKMLPKKENLWIYLMAGQSNMAGRGQVEPQDTLSNPRLLTINKQGKWILAKEPLNFNHPSRAKLDCGHSFGLSLLKCVPDSVSIAIIPCAVGGSSIDQWLDDSEHRNMHLWSNLKSQIEKASKKGTIKGVIWHQGESDANPGKLPRYKTKLNLLFTKIRNEVGDKNLPFVLGELGNFGVERPHWRALNKILNGISFESDKISLIPTSDLNDVGDKVHFNSPALRMMGKRYAAKMVVLENLPVNEEIKKLKKEAAPQRKK